MGTIVPVSTSNPKRTVSCIKILKTYLIYVYNDWTIEVKSKLINVTLFYWFNIIILHDLNWLTLLPVRGKKVIDPEYVLNVICPKNQENLTYIYKWKVYYF